MNPGGARGIQESKVGSYMWHNKVLNYLSEYKFMLLILTVWIYGRHWNKFTFDMYKTYKYHYCTYNMHWNKHEHSSVIIWIFNY